MKHFSNILLKQYFATKIPLSVFVSGVYLRIVDADDIRDSEYGYGMQDSGAMTPFDYRMIKHIKAGDNIIDIKTATEPKEDPNKIKPNPEAKDDKETDKEKT